MLFVLGLTFGSFVNALVWRLHTKRNWVSERSVCPHCKHILSAADLVPVLSWLSLRGKCRYCKRSISLQYPAVELLTGILFVISYIYWPYQWGVHSAVAFIAWLFSSVILVALFVYDVKWMMLPNKLVGAVTLSSAVVVLSTVESLRALIWSITGGVVIFGLFWSIFQISHGKWIGGGDVKLGFALGLLAGTPLKAILLIFIASLLGTIISLPLVSSKKMKSTAKISFGPFLITAAVVVFLFGTQIINWYVNTIFYS